MGWPAEAEQSAGEDVGDNVKDLTMTSGLNELSEVEAMLECLGDECFAEWLCHTAKCVAWCASYFAEGGKELLVDESVPQPKAWFWVPHSKAGNCAFHFFHNLAVVLLIIVVLSLLALNLKILKQLWPVGD